MAFSEAQRLPPKLCRAALLDAQGDEDKAEALLRDLKWLRLHAETEHLPLLSTGEDPAAALRRMNDPAATPDAKSVKERLLAERTKRKSFEAFAAAKAEAEAKERAKRGRKIDDPDFGTLTFDGHWNGSVDLPPFGTDLGLQVEVEEDEADELPLPSKRQREAFRKFADDAGTMYARLERATFDYYNEIRDDVRQFLGEELAAKKAPELEDSAEIWQLLEGPPSIFVSPDMDGDSITIWLGFNCTWDIEHGHYVRFEDGEITSVGSL